MSKTFSKLTALAASAVIAAGMLGVMSTAQARNVHHGHVRRSDGGIGPVPYMGSVLPYLSQIPYLAGGRYGSYGEPWNGYGGARHGFELQGAYD